MTQITSYPLNVIKKLIKQEFAECYPKYEIEFGTLDISDEALEPYEDECDEMVQTLKVSVHVNTPEENDPARCWHPWTLIWNCENSDFDIIMRDDQVACIHINESINDLTSDKLPQYMISDMVIKFSPITAVDFRQIVPQELLSDESKYVFNMPDGKKKYTVGEVCEFIYDTLSKLTLDEHFAGKEIYLIHLNIYDSGIVHPCFMLEPDEEGYEELPDSDICGYEDE